MHWKAAHENPNAPAVRSLLRQALADKKRGRIGDCSRFLEEFVTGRKVLDVGVVQHDLSQVERPGWKHGRIRGWASKVVGVDILPEQVAELNARGFDVRCVDATSDQHLGETFDRVVLGDVIEHVDSPVALLTFARRHLTADGLILCSTPNPFFISYIVEGLRRGNYIPNAEHVSWISPTMALELAHRAQLELKEYWHVQGEGKTLRRKLAVTLLTALQLRDTEPFSGSFYYIFGLPGGASAASS
jgi:2-polyprenyl-3-methyl-5-hydroxy-6-metoxy-1,4-benzoquinol methylase